MLQGEVMMILKSNHEIIQKAKDFFRNEIALNHIQNTKKLTKLKEFNLNPFLDKYKASFLTGNDDPLSIAKALIYPRVLGTAGIDIEFIDKTDGHRKYCQVKAGPNTINKDDIDTIKGHFTAVRHLARTNNQRIALDDLIIGVFYGTPEELNAHYKKLNEEYPVYVGVEFWFRLTGEQDFYHKLTNAISEVAIEFDSSQLVEEVIKELAEEIESLLKS